MRIYRDKMQKPQELHPSAEQEKKGDKDKGLTTATTKMTTSMRIHKKITRRWMKEMHVQVTEVCPDYVQLLCVLCLTNCMSLLLQ